MDKERLTPDDIQSIQRIVKDYVDTQPHTKREGRYPEILQAIVDSMCWDDGIVTDGNTTNYVHG